MRFTAWPGCVCACSWPPGRGCCGASTTARSLWVALAVLRLVQLLQVDVAYRGLEQLLGRTDRRNVSRTGSPGPRRPALALSA